MQSKMSWFNDVENFGEYPKTTDCITEIVEVPLGNFWGSLVGIPPTGFFFPLIPLEWDSKDCFLNLLICLI